MVAVLYLLLAVLRLGFLCSLLSRPIISAFLTSGAMIISSSQVSFPTDFLVLEGCTYLQIRSWTVKCSRIKSNCTNISAIQSGPMLQHA